MSTPIDPSRMPGFHQDAQGNWASNTGAAGRDDQGRQFFTQKDGSKFYYAPRFDDPDNPTDSFLRNAVWDTNTGTWKRSTNWGNLAVLGAAGLIAGPAAYSAMGGGGGGLLPATMGAPPGLVVGPTAAGAAGATAAGGSSAAAAAAAAAAAKSGTGAGMRAGLGSLADFFNSRGGSTAIDALAGLYGTKKSADASNRAADLQAEAARKALEWAKQQYQQAMEQYNNWQNGSDMGRLSDLSRQTPDLSRFY